MTKIVHIKKIVEAKNVENKEALLKKQDLQITLREDDCMKVGKMGGHIILDFGCEMHGGIKIATFHAENEKKEAKIRIRFGESLTEACSEIGEKNSTNEHSPRDFETVLTFMSTVEVGHTGYRFVRIDFYPGAELTIKAIAGTNTILSRRAKYTYQGQDKNIKKIFGVAKRTVDLCASSGYIWDGVKRDRLIWIGDLYPEILSLTTLYGRLPEIENSLAFESRRKPEFSEGWLCSLCTYNLWWVACLSEYYLRVGDKVLSFVKKELPFLYKSLELFNKYVDEDGKMNCPENTEFFVDWPCLEDKEETYVGSRFIAILAAKKASEMLSAIGEDASVAEKLLRKLMRGDMTVKGRKQVIGLKYAALGEISDSDYEKLIRNGADGMSTFMSYFILTAIASRDKDLAMEIMKEYYGAMLEKGATTFWEDFEMSWNKGSGRIDAYPKTGEKDIHGDFGKYCYLGFRHSLCHAWSSGVITFIEENCK